MAEFNWSIMAMAVAEMFALRSNCRVSERSRQGLGDSRPSETQSG